MLFTRIAEILLAQAEANPADAAGGGAPAADPMASLKQLLLFLVPTILIFWLIVFRPESKRRKEKERMIANVKKGDTVVTQSGVIGKIWRVDDKEVILVLDKDKDVKAHFVKSAISDVLPADAAT
jgi:preprotein translocase subunit YajC